MLFRSLFLASMLASETNTFLEVVATTSKSLLTGKKILIKLHSGCARAGLPVGKSALAHKIVDFLRADDCLATFVLLLRASGTSSDPATVIQSLARGLWVLHPRAIPQVATAARASGHLVSLHELEYIESYLINPMHSLLYPYTLVIVVDGGFSLSRDA